jgi:hypothetical protein
MSFKAFGNMHSPHNKDKRRVQKLRYIIVTAWLQNGHICNNSVREENKERRKRAGGSVPPGLYAEPYG